MTFSTTLSRVLGSEVRNKPPFATSLLANGSTTAAMMSLDVESASLDPEVASEVHSSWRCQRLLCFSNMRSNFAFIAVAESNDTLQEGVETCRSLPVELVL